MSRPPRPARKPAGRVQNFRGVAGQARAAASGAARPKKGKDSY